MSADDEVEIGVVQFVLMSKYAVAPESCWISSKVSWIVTFEGKFAHPCTEIVVFNPGKTKLIPVVSKSPTTVTGALTTITTEELVEGEVEGAEGTPPVGGE